MPTTFRCSSLPLAAPDMSYDDHLTHLHAYWTGYSRGTSLAFRKNAPSSIMRSSEVTMPRLSSFSISLVAVTSALIIACGGSDEPVGVNQQQVTSWDTVAVGGPIFILQTLNGDTPPLFWDVAYERTTEQAMELIDLCAAVTISGCTVARYPVQLTGDTLVVEYGLSLELGTQRTLMYQR